MVYTEQTWADSPATTTPLSAARLTHMETGIGEASDRATALETRATNVEGRATTLEGDVDAVELRATNLETRATTLEGDVDAVELRATNLETRATDLETRATNVEGRATTLEGDTAALDTRTDDLEVRAAALEGTGVRPADAGLIGWTLSPDMAVGTVIPGTGVLHLMELRLPAGTISGLAVIVTVAGAGLTADQNLLALYDSGGTLLGQTASQHTAWSAVGEHSAPLTAGVNIGNGRHYIGLLTNGTTAPTLVASYPDARPNAFRQAPYRAATSGTALTALPATVNVAAAAAISQLMLAAAL